MGSDEIGQFDRVVIEVTHLVIFGHEVQSQRNDMVVSGLDPDLVADALSLVHFHPICSNVNVHIYFLDYSSSGGICF